MNEIHRVVTKDSHEKIWCEFHLPIKTTEEILEYVRKIDGVARVVDISVDIFAMYVKVGKCFDREKVLDTVNKQLMIYLDKRKI